MARRSIIRPRRPPCCHLRLIFLSAVSIAGVGWFVETDRLIAAVFMAAYGVFFLPLYAMILAYMNDKLKPSQMVSASATLYIFTAFLRLSGRCSAPLL